MGNTWFQFQQFRVEQKQSAMKISTDAILLGGLADNSDPTRILDIGTGTGVVALMLAQRFERALVSAVELDKGASKEANFNFQESPFAKRLKLIHGDIQSFDSGQKFDLIVSNPPYFSDHLKSKSPKRNQALHTDKLSFQELVHSVDKLLSDSGEFWVILPPRQMDELSTLFENLGFSGKREFSIKDNPEKRVQRIVKSFTRKQVRILTAEYSLKDQEGGYTEFYKGILSGFLLGY